ncbi:membrane fusion protein (multidrug efflux system) [Luteibacter rhizovicinus]|uniref:Membrane fusion protein (Multidrug efflux system) n=1 Tax=Luteibacter rhizovicinus TaxID=242606 RepID=A0A4R3YP21_9GAMM|nr:membrane fusion protein (multidrug efflux system) [Luteibacter rhizovicinus]
MLGVALVATLGAVVWGWHWWTLGRFLATTDDAYVGGDITAIAPKVAGFIDEVRVTDNQRVHAGELLVRLDDRDYRAQAEQAAAAVTSAQAAIANLDARRHLQSATIDETRAGTFATAAEVVRAGTDVERYRHIVGSAVSRQVLDQADATHKKSLADDARARSAVKASERQLDVIDAERSQAVATLAQAQAALRVAELNLEHTRLVAPIDGVVGNRSARPGAYATIGAQLMSVVPASGMWIDANFKESQLADMHPGQHVDIRADVLPGERFDGRVESIAPATGAQFSLLPPENATGNFTKIVQRVPVRVRLEGASGTLGRLRPGLSVIATVDTRDAPR